MTEISARRVAAFQRKFPDRETLPLEDLYSEYFSADALPPADVKEVLSLLASELAIPVGLLRPGDRMADILKPVHSGNPLRWIEEWTRAADGKAELNDQLRRRLEAKGNLSRWPSLPTVRDVVHAWCGRLPTVAGAGSTT